MFRVPAAAACLAVAAALIPTLSSAQAPRPGAERRGVEQRGYDERGRPDFGERYFHDERRGQGIWERLGELRVRPRIEREVIAVDPREGRLGRVGLKVFDSDIEVIELALRYDDGDVERVAINTILKAGTNLPPVDIRGWRSRLKAVEVTYRPYGLSRMEILGEHWRPNRPGARWEDLGCQRVGFLDDKDVIRVGRDEGRFRAIKLTVEGNKVRLVKLRVVYGNGQVEDLAARTVIPEGMETRPFDLSGRYRGIDRIELYYLPQISFGGRATVCAYGM